MRSHYGFDSFVCQPGIKGSHEKGGVEGEVGRFRRRHLVPVPRVASMLSSTCSSRPALHATTGGTSTSGGSPSASTSLSRPTHSGACRPRCSTCRWWPATASTARAGSLFVAVSTRSRPATSGGDWTSASAPRPSRPSTAPTPSLPTPRGLKGDEILVLDHYLEVLAIKTGAFPGATALARARAAGTFGPAHERFWANARRRLGDRPGTSALIEVLLLHRSASQPAA